MTLTQLNEFNLFGNKNKELKFKKQGDFIEFDLSDNRFKKDSIKFIKIRKRDGYPNLVGQYRAFIRARGHVFKVIDPNFDNLIREIIRTLKDLRIMAKSSRTETAPADIPYIEVKDFKGIKAYLDK